MRILFVSLFIIIADQVSKIMVKGISIPSLNIDLIGFSYGESISIIEPFFKFTFVENPGMAFGIHVDGYFKIFLSLFRLIASFAILFYIYKQREQNIYFRTGFALILGGAVGNLIDSLFYGVIYDYAPLFYGKVVDFIHVDAFGFSILGKTFSSFPIFNIADSSVTIGVIILILFHKTFEEKEKVEVANSTEEVRESIETSSE